MWLMKITLLYKVRGLLVALTLLTRLRQTIAQKLLLNWAQRQWPILTESEAVCLLQFLRPCQDLNMRLHKSQASTLTICVPEIFADLKSYRKANIIRN